VCRVASIMAIFVAWCTRCCLRRRRQLGARGWWRTAFRHVEDRRQGEKLDLRTSKAKARQIEIESKRSKSCRPTRDEDVDRKSQDHADGRSEIQRPSVANAWAVRELFAEDARSGLGDCRRIGRDDCEMA
jgi:hypothetical protein